MTLPLLRCSVQVEVNPNSFALQLQRPRNNNSCDDNGDDNCYTNINYDNYIND